MNTAASPRRLIKAPKVLQSLDIGITSLYAQVKARLLPPQIKLGRTSVWVADEIAAVVDARIAGQTDDEIRALVSRLVTERTRATETENVIARAPQALAGADGG